MNVQKITKDMSRDELINEIDALAEALTDVLDGESVGDIMSMTGWSEERSQEIHDLSQKYLAANRD